MSAQTYVNDAGVARLITEVWANDAGTARRITEIWVNDNGTARQVFAGAQVTLSNISCTSSMVGVPATAQYTLSSTGDINGTLNTNTVIDRDDWLTPKTGMSNYEARATVTSGTLTSGTTGAWQSLGTSRTWTLTTSGIAQVVMTIEIRRASDAVVQDSATITLNASTE
jgi:hypothetical protein